MFYVIFYFFSLLVLHMLGYIAGIIYLLLCFIYAFTLAIVLCHVLYVWQVQHAHNAPSPSLIQPATA